MTGGVHEIAVARAARQLGTTASGPDLSIKTLGTARIESPLTALLDARQTTEHYVDESDRVLLNDTLSMIRAREGPLSELSSFEPAASGARSSSTHPRPGPASSPVAGCAPDSTTSSAAWSAT